MTTGPRRLVHDDADLASMLAAADKEGPSQAEIERALSLADRIPLTAAPSIWRWLVPTLAGIAVMGSALGVVVVRRSTSASIPLPVEAATVAPRAPIVREVEPPPTPAPAAMLTISVDDLATVTTPRPSAETSARAVATKVSATHSTFAEEVALVAAARSALERGDAVTCKRTVEQYHERFRAGTFAQELEVIRIEALVVNREDSRARDAAERFLATNERSPYADRVRSLVGQTQR